MVRRTRKNSQWVEVGWSIRVDDYTIELADLGDGHSGDYDPEIDGDQPLLRINVFDSGARGVIMATAVSNLTIGADEATRIRLLGALHKHLDKHGVTQRELDAFMVKFRG